MKWESAMHDDSMLFQIQQSRQSNSFNSTSIQREEKKLQKYFGNPNNLNDVAFIVKL